MADVNIPERLITILEGQALLNGKLDSFIRDQNRHEAELSTIKAELKAQERIELKLDGFIKAQSRVDEDIDTLKNDLKVVKETLTSYNTYLKAASAFIGIIWIPITLFVVPYIQKMLGL